MGCGASLQTPPALEMTSPLAYLGSNALHEVILRGPNY